MQGCGWRKVATGSWLYDGIVPMPIAIWAKPASQSASRYDGDERLDETRPIPQTIDGCLYSPIPGRGEYLTANEAQASADTEPWGPIRWDDGALPQ